MLKSSKPRYKTKRALQVLFILSCITSGVLILLYNMHDNIIFFYPPSKVDVSNIRAGTTFRVGGLVKIGSVFTLSPDSIEFTLTDDQKEIKIQYQGILPVLFREGQGAVAEGSFDTTKTIFKAREILTKHDENYMPP
jgi:cytochrome c-type biogenesis protein CcmE